MPKKRYGDVYGAFERKYMVSFQNIKDKLLTPFLKILAKLNIPPSLLSYSSIIFGILFLVYIKNNINLALELMIIAVAFDALDGPLARYTKKASLEGSLIDGFSDHMLVVMTTIGFLLINIIYGWIAVMYVFTYTSLYVLMVIRNIKGIPYKWPFRPRLLVYLLFFIYVIWNFNILNHAMLLFSIIMFIQMIVGFFKVKEVLT